MPKSDITLLMLAPVMAILHYCVMSEIRDLSEYGISFKDQMEWHTTNEAFKAIPPYPEALKDISKPVIVLNLLSDFTQPHSKSTIRLLVGKIDRIFRSGLQTQESWDRHRQFDADFPTDGRFEGSTFVFQRTKITHLPKTYYDLTKEPTETEWGRTRAQDTPAVDLIAAFGLGQTEVGDAEVVIVPPPQVDLQQYVEAAETSYGKTPHIAFYTTIRFADNVSWVISEYQPGMPNLMALETSAL